MVIEKLNLKKNANKLIRNVIQSFLFLLVEPPPLLKVQKTKEKKVSGQNKNGINFSQ